MVALLLMVAAWLPVAPALAASSCWFGAPSSPSGALPACSDPDRSLDLIGRFHLQLITLPTEGAGTIDLLLLDSPDELVGVEVRFDPPLEVPGSAPALRGRFDYRLAIAANDTDYFLRASLAIRSPPADPPAQSAAITLVQTIPEVNASLDAGDQPSVSLYREPDSLQSITLLGRYTLSSGSLSAIHNGFGIFVLEPPAPEPAPAPLPFAGAAMALASSRALRRRVRQAPPQHLGSPGAGPGPGGSALAADRRQ